jgi:D-lyxose ketol-isomerase
MKPEINAVLQEVKQSLANPQPNMPDFKNMSIMEATKWCVANGITANVDIVKTTGKSTNTVSTALWKLRNPKRVKALYRRAKKLRDIKAGSTSKPKATAIKVKITKPKITNGLYDDGMETPYTDSVRRTRFNFLDEEKQPLHELVAENRRLKILLEHYESLLFKGGK